MPATTHPAFSALGQRAAPPSITRLMTMALENPRLLSLAAGFTDNRTLPVGPVADALTALAAGGGEPEYLQYGTNQGRPGLRRGIAQRLDAQDGTGPAPGLAGRIIVTNGSQQALYLAMQTLCDPGDIVLVDRPSYFVVLEMLAGMGVRAQSMPVDARGRIEPGELRALLRELERKGERARVKAAYFVSYFSNPSGRSMAEAEKTALAGVLAECGFVVPVIEDAAYRELYFEQPFPARSILGLEAFAMFPRFYTGTFTKSLATGLKVGFGVCTDQAWLTKMLHVKGQHDFGTANFNQALCEHLLAQGGFDRHLATVRPAYQGKMRVLDETLRAGRLPEGGWQWDKPAGGLYLWLQAPAQLDTGLASEFCHTCVETGVLYVPGELCFGDHPARNTVRLSFGVLGEADLREAGRRLAAVASRFA